MRALSVAFLCCASPVFAQDTDAADVAALTVAIQDAGCIVTAENGDAILAASGLSDEDTMSVVATMYAAGVVALEADGTMKLTNEVCK